MIWLNILYFFVPFPEYSLFVKVKAPLVEQFSMSNIDA